VEGLTYREQMYAKVAQEELDKRSVIQSNSIDLSTQFIERSTNDIQWQRKFIADQSPNKALFGERRGGKSTVMGICAIAQALAHPFSQILYVGLTEASVKKIMYDQVLAMLKRKHDLPATLIGNNEMRFVNGSIIYLIGLDANKKQKEKVRGVKASLILMDEMQSYTQDARLIIKEVLGPAAADTKASTILGGTAWNSLGKNYWHEITKDNTKQNPIGPSLLHPEWKVYRCEWVNNTAIDEMTGNRICDNVAAYLAKERADHPGIELTDSYRQEWNAEWIIQTSSLIYRYSNANLLHSPLCREIDTNRIISMADGFMQGATYILGIDLGYNDPTALTVVAYNLRYSNKLFVIETFKQSEMLVADVAMKIKQLDEHYHFTYMVGDISSLQVFETLKQNYSLPIEKANRAGKLSHQYTLNSDLQTRSVIIMPGNDELIEQLKTCVWLQSGLDDGKHIEDPAIKNDLSDSFLYAHNFSRHMWYTAPKVIVSEADYFTQAIFKGEQVASRLDFVDQQKKRFSPYQRNKRI
jgi:hypothetical protein